MEHLALKSALLVLMEEFKKAVVYLSSIFYLRSRVNVITGFLDAGPESGKEVAATRYRYEFFSEDRLHLACKIGDLVSVRELVARDRKLCLKKDRFGRAPIHIAAQKGRVDVINIFLKSCPESVKEVTATSETSLHMAVMHNKTRIVQQLLKWIEERPDFVYLLNWGDYEGNTALHLSTSRKQLQTLKVLLSSELVDVNALNSGGFTALDILYVLPYTGKIDMEIDMILRQAGAMRARDFINQRIKEHSDDCCSRNRSSDLSTVKSIVRSRNVLLVITTLLATVTYQAAFHSLGSNFKDGHVYSYVIRTGPMNKQFLVISSSFILFNSMVFIASVVMAIFLLHEFPLKPWPQISVSTLFGSYMCSIMAISPNEAMALFFVSIPFLLLAAAGKLYSFASHSLI